MYIWAAMLMYMWLVLFTRERNGQISLIWLMSDSDGRTQNRNHLPKVLTSFSADVRCNGL
jgi:hypothetical protein